MTETTFIERDWPNVLRYRYSESSPSKSCECSGTMNQVVLAIVFVLSSATWSYGNDPARDTIAKSPVSFARDVLPLLEKRCNKCHQPDEAQSGLDLTRVDTIQRGGDELGAGIVPGSPESSPLIRVLTGKAEPAMPSEGDSLPEAEIDLLRRWIQEGAKDDSPQFSREDVDFFEREIRPVLFARCFKCHATRLKAVCG